MHAAVRGVHSSRLRLNLYYPKTVHMFTTHRPTLTLQLHNFDLFRTCSTALLRGSWQDFNRHDASRGHSAQLSETYEANLYIFTLLFSWMICTKKYNFPARTFTRFAKLEPRQHASYTLHNALTLTFHLLTLNSGRTWQVT